MDWNPEILASTLSTFKLIRRNERKWMLCWFTKKNNLNMPSLLEKVLTLKYFGVFWKTYFTKPLNNVFVCPIHRICFLALESQTIASAVYYNPQNLLHYFLCLYANAWNRKLFTMNAKEYFNELFYNDRHTSYANVISCKMVMIAKP